jgi:hypothetical protein
MGDLFIRKEIRKILKELKEKKDSISYSAVVLDEDSRKKLINDFSHIVPESWEFVCHHMTICLGELPSDLKSDIGKKVSLKVVKWGVSGKAMAVQVEGYYSEKAIPHITIAINKKAGAKPVDSNKIENWKDWGFTPGLTLNGTIEEVPQPNQKN